MSDPAREVASVEDVDRSGALSILLQGGLFRANLVMTANHCAHWRALFPNAEIVLSVSVSDAVTGDVDIGGSMSGTRLVPRLAGNGVLAAALASIVTVCDRLVLSPGATPLPPIKTDSGINNCNLQIAAARAGLAHVSGAYTLRVRSDFVFADRSFLAYYAETHRQPRGRAAVLKQRVLISEFFTLNPYTLERMPLHVSDWFHFGLTEDVRALWDVPAMSFADAVYYKTVPHAPGSNVPERRFLVRLAVEQHIAKEALARHFPDLRLDYHNDLRSRDLTMRILLDNFVICDTARCRVLLDKYKRNFTDGKMRVVCVTADDWRTLATAREVDFASFFARKIHLARRRLFLRHHPLVRPFRYASKALASAACWLVGLSRSGRVIGMRDPSRPDLHLDSSKSR